jgi:hypothetical protein
MGLTESRSDGLRLDGKVAFGLNLGDGLGGRGGGHLDRAVSGRRGGSRRKGVLKRVAVREHLERNLASPSPCVFFILPRALWPRHVSMVGVQVMLSTASA